MPAIKKTISAEQIAARKQIYTQAIAAGAIQMHQKLAQGVDARFEEIMVDDRGCIARNYQPMPVAEWVADCNRRNVIAVVPNL